MTLIIRGPEGRGGGGAREWDGDGGVPCVQHSLSWALQPDLQAIAAIRLIA